MKRLFVKPSLMRYDLNSKENIVASVSPIMSDEKLTAMFSFTYAKNQELLDVSTTDPNQGCFHYLFGGMDYDIMGLRLLNSSTDWWGFLKQISVSTDPFYSYYKKCVIEWVPPSS